MSAQDVIRKHGIANDTFYWWKSKYDGMEVSEAKCLRELEAKAIAGGHNAGKNALEDVQGKNW